MKPSMSTNNKSPSSFGGGFIQCIHLVTPKVGNHQCRYGSGVLPLMPNFEFPPNFRITNMIRKPVKATAAMPTTTYTCDVGKQTYTSCFKYCCIFVSCWIHSITSNMEKNEKDSAAVFLDRSRKYTEENKPKQSTAD